jgi:TonB family protein
MRKLFLASIIFVALSAAAATAQEEITVRWKRVAPEAEAFAVLMPEPPARSLRVIPFSQELKLATPVYEAEQRGVLFSVVSVAKREVAALKSCDDFVDGLRHAVQHSSRAAESEFTFEREVTRDKQTGRQYFVRAEGAEGTAQVYETATHYYVLMTLGAQASDPSASNFFNSFDLDIKRGRAASDRVTISGAPDSSASTRAPQPLWSAAGSLSVTGRTAGTGGPIGPIGPVNPGGAVRADSPAAPPADVTPETPTQNTISGGVLNGKAFKKPQPEYPGMAVAARAQGVVAVQITVDEEGYVIAARAVSGHPLLQQAAVKAARQARFTPTRLEGRPVKVRGVITYNFVLGNNPDEPPTRRY